MAALAAATMLASCASPPPPPPPPPPPSVSLAPKFIEQASAYRAYVAKATAISPLFANGEQVAEGVRVGAAYQPDQLLRGAIAYGAVAALQDPTFVAGVRKYVADATQRQQIAYEIMKNPSYALGIDGAGSAANLVVAALGEDGRKLLEQGRQVKYAAYEIQKSAWSKGEVAGREDRLLKAKQLSAAVGVGDAAETARLEQASTGAGPLGLTPATAAPPYSNVVVRSLAIAALGALGYGDDEHIDQLNGLAADAAMGKCLNMSKLNVYQCLAVSKPYYEDVFCLGQHAMEDTGSCLVQGVGLPIPADPIVEAAKARAAEKAKVTKVSTKRRPAKKSRR